MVNPEIFKGFSVDLRGKVAVVLGASAEGGTGWAIAESLAARLIPEPTAQDALPLALRRIQQQDFDDIATIDAQGVMQIRDRSKDLIKTGGEWISSIDVENIAVSHPDVAEAAVINARHERWQERPLLFVVRKQGHTLDRQEILDFLARQVTRLCVPDEVIFLESLPVGGTGKVQKSVLRAKYSEVFTEP